MPLTISLDFDGNTMPIGQVGPQDPRVEMLEYRQDKQVRHVIECDPEDNGGRVIITSNPNGIREVNGRLELDRRLTRDRDIRIGRGESHIRKQYRYGPNYIGRLIISHT